MKIHKKICLCAVALFFSVTVCGCDFFESVSFVDSSSSEQLYSTASEMTVQHEENHYGYNSIDDAAVRELYDEIDLRIDGFEITDLCVNGVLSTKQILQAIEVYKLDHPEKFWLKSSVKSGDDGKYTYIDLEYTMEQEELIASKKAFRTKVDEIVDNAPENASSFELEIYIHDYLVKNCIYDSETADDPDEIIKNNAYDAYGALVDGKAVCEGYSRAFSMLCRELDIDCVCVSGLGNDSLHMWNSVCLEGKWYNVDVTWDDPDSEEEDLSVFKYAFFNMNDTMFGKHHKAGELYVNISDEDYKDYGLNCNAFVPACTSNDYYYYNVNGTLLYDINDDKAMSEAIAQAAINENEYVYFTVDESLNYEEIYNLLIEEALADWIYRANDEYGMSLNPQTYVYSMEQFNLIAVAIVYQ